MPEKRRFRSIARLDPTKPAPPVINRCSYMRGVQTPNSTRADEIAYIGDFTRGPKTLVPLDLSRAPCRCRPLLSQAPVQLAVPFSVGFPRRAAPLHHVSRRSAPSRPLQSVEPLRILRLPALCRYRSLLLSAADPAVRLPLEPLLDGCAAHAARMGCSAADLDCRNRRLSSLPQAGNGQGGGIRRGGDFPDRRIFRLPHGAYRRHDVCGVDAARVAGGAAFRGARLGG